MDQVLPLEFTICCPLAVTPETPASSDAVTDAVRVAVLPEPIEPGLTLALGLESDGPVVSGAAGQLGIRFS